MQSYWMQMSDTATRARIARDRCAAARAAAAAGAHARSSAQPRRVRRGPRPARHRPAAGRRSAERAPARSLPSGPKSRISRPGDRVMGRCAGAFAEYALMEEAEAMAMPPGLSWDEAASVALTFLVSYDMLVLQGRLQAGEWLLDQRRVVRRRRGLASTGQGAGREGHRHLGFGGQAGVAEARSVWTSRSARARRISLLQ